MKNEDQEPEPVTVQVPVDDPDPLTRRHREFIKAEPLAAQHWDSRIWRRA